LIQLTTDYQIITRVVNSNIDIDLGIASRRSRRNSNKKINTKSYIEVAKLPMFNEEASRIRKFTIVYRLYLRILMRRATVEKKIQ